MYETKGSCMLISLATWRLPIEKVLSDVCLAGNIYVIFWVETCITMLIIPFVATHLVLHMRPVFWTRVLLISSALRLSYVGYKVAMMYRLILLLKLCAGCFKHSNYRFGTDTPN